MEDYDIDIHLLVSFSLLDNVMIQVDF